MKRRRFLGTALAAGLGQAISSPAGAAQKNQPLPAREKDPFLESVMAKCRLQLFDQYLAFWEAGGYDSQNGGFMCYLHDDGSVENDRKDIWYQGRGIWVYAFLYNEIDRNERWLERARKSRDFMVARMHNGDGTWRDTVNRTGQPVDGIAIDRSNNIYGALFAAAGLIQYARATGSQTDLDLARLSLLKSIDRYEDPGYPGVVAPGEEAPGLRAQGHAFMFVWVVPQFLELDDDPRLAAVLGQQLESLEDKFWNAEYGISNEILLHDYSRLPSQADRMIPGHSIEAQWMCMREALRNGDWPRFHRFKERMHRLIRMTWDYPFGGTCDTAYQVFPSDDTPAGPVLDIKTMWAQAEVAIGCLLAYQQTRETWAREWFERSWNFIQRTMVTDCGVWRQAVDRQGKDKQREGISIHRKGNFHQPRCLMYLMLTLRQILASD